VSFRAARPAIISRPSSIAPAFYPTSGGQPHDVGTLGGARVVDVVDAGEEIRHVLETPVAASSSVTGIVDWARRFDHMQQHTGQHILSAAFDRGPGVRTMSFHLGAETATIDLAREVSAAENRCGRARCQPRGVGEPAGVRPFRDRRRGRAAAASQGSRHGLAR
jgi:hypothetical protein